MDVGALSLLISERGFADVMGKVAAVDAAAARVGAKVTDVKVAAPAAAGVQQALQRIQATTSAIAGQQVSFRFDLAGAVQAQGALGSVVTSLGAVARAEDEMRSGAASLAEAQRRWVQEAQGGSVAAQAAWQRQREAAALAAAETQRAAAGAKRAAAEEVSARQIVRQQLVGDVTQLVTYGRTVDTTNARAVAAWRTEATAIRQQAVEVGNSAQQIARVDAALARFERRVQSVASQSALLTNELSRQSAVVDRSSVPFNKAGAAAQAQVPRFRSAANAVTAIAFAATAVEPNFQSIALAGGLMASSLLASMGPVAGIVGAAVVALTALIGVVIRLNAAAKPTAAALEHIGNIDRVTSYNRALQATDDQLAALLPKMTAWERFRSFNPLVNLGLAPTESEKQFNQLLANREALVKRGVELAREEARAVAAARRDAAVAAANDQLRITQSLIDRQESLNQQGYALGQISLRQYFDDRQGILKARIDAEIAALQAERAELAKPLPGKVETDPESIERRTRVRSLDAEIEAAQTRRKTADQSLMAEREAAERALAQRIAGFERQRMEAQGQTHEARLAQIEQEAEEFQRALAVSPDFTPQAKADMANAFRDALTAAEAFRVKQEEIQRALEQLGIERAAVERQVAEGALGEVEGAERIAELERARIPLLQQLQRELLKLAIASKNPEAIASAEKLNAELEQLGKNFELAAFQKSLASSVADTITSGITGGIDAAIQSGSIGRGFQVLAGGFLSGLGGLFVTIGKRALVGLAIIQKIVTAILALSPAAGIAAALALIAFGGVLQSLGGRAAGGGDSGGGGVTPGVNDGRARAQSERDGTVRVPLDPDRTLRERRAVAPTVSASPSTRAIAPPAPIVYNLQFLGHPTPQTERWVRQNFNGGEDRGMDRSTR